MPLNRIRKVFTVLAAVSAMLLGLSAESAPRKKSKALPVSALASQRDSDPAINGSVGDALQLLSDADLQAAAIAARRDTDPDLNGGALAWPTRELLLVKTRTLDDAWVAYERCHWHEAFSTFAELADRGDPEAARMAMSMVTHGPALYQQTFDIPAERVNSWRRLGKLLATATEQAAGPNALEPRR